jgi:predicted small lipoprotein YifL
MTPLRTIVAAFLVALGLAGCGQSGPLYIPGNPSEVAVPAERPAPAAEPADEEEEDRDDNGSR